MRPNSWRALLILAAAAVPLQAHAHDAARWGPGGAFTVELEGGYEYVNVPTTEVAIGGGETDDTFTRWTTGLTLGFVDADGMVLPDPIGENARIEVSVRYASGGSDRSHLSGGIIYTGVDAVGPIVFTAGTIDMDTDYDSWEADLLYSTDVIFADSLAFSPFVGLTYHHFDFDNAFELGNSVNWDDHTRTHAGGLVLGGDLGFRPVSWLGFSTGLRLDLLGADAHTKAWQSSPFHGRRSEYDSDTSFLGRAEGRGGVSVAFGPMRLGVEGYVRWQSYFAAVDYPLPGDVHSAHLHHDEMWSGGGRASLTVAF